MFLLFFDSHGGGAIQEIIDQNENYKEMFGAALFQADVGFKMWNAVSLLFAKLGVLVFF